MKYRKLLALLLAAAMVAVLFAGCAASKAEDYYAGDMEMGNGAAADGIYDSAGSSTSGAGNQTSSIVTDRKLIRRVELNAETEELDTLLSNITAKVSALGGYVENRNVYTGSAYSSRSQSRYANLTIRVPADRLDEFVSHVDENSNVTSSRENTEDVTLSYVATESRMKALQAEEERLLALIGEAANLTELLELESRLTDVRTELESVTSQLRLYDNLVDYATVDLSISEVVQYTPKEEPGFWQRISSGFTESMENLGIFMKELVIFLITTLPYMLPLAVIAVVVVVIIKVSVRKRRRKRRPPFPTQDTAKE